MAGKSSRRNNTIATFENNGKLKAADVRFVLASASPRRRQLLLQAGMDFEVLPAAGEEKSSKTDPAAYVQELAAHKASEIARFIRTGEEKPQRPWTCVIGADTIVVCGGKILGKPADEEDAEGMLRMLQGRDHEVMTGVCAVFLKAPSGAGDSPLKVAFSETTKVHVFRMTGDEIRSYIRTGEPMDKAGAYGIQGRFGIYVRGIEGDYNNVVGLPIARLYQELKQYILF